MDFAFNHEKADFVFGCDIADYNLRSQKAFQKNGFVEVGRIEQTPGLKARFVVDFVLSLASHP